MVVSVGPNNYGHPTTQALTLYRLSGADTYRTDLNGTVTVTVEPGGKYSIRAERGAATPGRAPVVLPAPSGPTVQPKPSTSPPADVYYPNCAAVNAADNLFCEVCGFDFTTGVMPRVEGGEPSFLDLPTPSLAGSAASAEVAKAPLEVPGSAPDPAAGPSRTGPGGEAGAAPDTNRAAEPETATPPVPASDPTPAAAPRPAPTAGPSPAPTSSAEDERPGAGAGAPATPVPPAGGGKPLNRPPSREVAGDWVVEVWIDPDWYAAQDTGEACPSPAPPEVVRLAGSDALVGRRSRTSVPDVDCGIDSAVSRRQALLTSDGRRWWVEDLDSSNGTWVGPAVGPLPTEPISGRIEIDADDRIYVGAWTRLVLRPAVDSEITPG